MLESFAFLFFRFSSEQNNNFANGRFSFQALADFAGTASSKFLVYFGELTRDDDRYVRPTGLFNPPDRFGGAVRRFVDDDCRLGNLGLGEYALSPSWPPREKSYKKEALCGQS